MKKTIMALMAAGLTFSSTTAFAAATVSAEGLDIWVSGGTIEADVGFQTNVPDVVISELAFEPDGNYLGLGARYQFLPTMFPAISLSLDWKDSRHFEGDVGDTDYLASNPNSVWFYSTSDTDGNWGSWDVNVGFEGVNLKDGKVTAEALIGYQQHEYDFSISNNHLTTAYYLGSNSYAFGEVATYEAMIEGPYVGIAGKAWLTPHIGLNASIKYFIQPEGEAEGNWLLRDLTFSQEGDGHGYDLSAGVTFIPKENWYLGLQINQTNLELDDGTENLFALSGTHRFLGSDELDYIEFDSYSTEARAGFLF